MSKSYDLVVLGTGSAAGTVAYKANSAGMSVAVVDDRPFGGTCALRGCDPKKVLVEATRAIDTTRRRLGQGVKGNVQIAWRELMEFKRSFTHPVPKNSEETFKKNGIDTYHGYAIFDGPSLLRIDGEEIRAEKYHIATGARPAELPIQGFAHLAKSDDFLDMLDLPERISFVGGGYVSLELGHVAARAGAEVTIFQREDHVLPKFDTHLTELLAERTTALGVELHLETQVKSIAEDNEVYTVHAEKDGESIDVEADLVVHGAGRIPNIDCMGLDTANVKYGRNGIEVNEYMQSVSNPAVYAAGDAAAGGLPLTPVAAFEAQAVAENIIKGNTKKVEYPPIPSTVFTLPQLASVGLTEHQAKEQGLDFRVNQHDIDTWASARRTGQEYSAFKVLIDKSTDKILGAHLLRQDAGDFINLFTLAMHTGMTTTDIKKTIFAYPTMASDIKYML